MAVTGGIVAWYTIEAKRLRETAQRQIAVSQRQVEMTQEQMETMQRPFVVIDPTWNEGRLIRFIVRNVGNSAAVNVELIYGQYTLGISIIDNKERVSVGIREDSEVTAAIEELMPPDDLVFILDATSISRGVPMKIEYCNVAMMQYHTTERILPGGVIIESSGKMGTYNPFA